MSFDEQIDLLRSWYEKHNDGAQLSRETAEKIMKLVKWYGYKVFDAAYDIFMDGKTFD